MKLPAIAAKSFNQYQNHPVYRSIFQQTLNQLRQIFSPIARAKLVHAKIEEHLNKNLSDPIVAKHISCKKGCTACCHTQVSVSHDEAELLSNKILSGSILIDIDRLANQAQTGDDSTKWYKLDYQSRQCVFLDSEGSCSVYADRPSVCRSNYSISDASFCSTEDGVEKPHRLLNTHQSNMVLTAGYYAAKGGGALPHLLWKKITSKFDKKSRSNENNP